MTIYDFHGEGTAFLSNFWEEPARGGFTVEHFYQAAKAAKSDDSTLILGCATPGQAKRMGRKVPMRPDWDEIKDAVMLDNLRWKFTLDRTLTDKLIATGTEELVEGNTWGDTYWGQVQNNDGVWIGLNRLGTLLMQVREEVAFYSKVW